MAPATWRQAAQAGDATAYRHYWELCVLLALRDGLRSGDVFVPGSRRYADPAAYLLTAAGSGEPSGLEFCQLVGKPADAARSRWPQAGDELHAALARARAASWPARRRPGPPRTTTAS